MADSAPASQRSNQKFSNGYNYISVLSIVKLFSDKGVTIGTWCNGYGDFLQVDHKTMVDYSDIGSKQNRFCGSSTCK